MRLRTCAHVHKVLSRCCVSLRCPRVHVVSLGYQVLESTTLAQDGIILVYDICDRESFNHVDEWLNEVNRSPAECS